MRTPGEHYDQYPRRVAFLIDPRGVVQRVYDVSDVAGFAELVLDDLSDLQTEPPQEVPT
jgi:peroxiredoxin